MRRGTKRSRTSGANGKQLAATDETFHHSVYVILLDPSVLRHPSILRLNPNLEPTKPSRSGPLLLCMHSFSGSKDVQEGLQSRSSFRRFQPRAVERKLQLVHHMPG